MPIATKRYELNITLRCNAACPLCNRLSNLGIYTEEDDMELWQVQDFLGQLRRTGRHAKRVKIAGGEPTLHPMLPAILAVLMGGIEEGLIGKVKIDTNGIAERPTVPVHPKVFWHRDKPKTKRHLPIFWSPTDLKLKRTWPCNMPQGCGISLDRKGYLPCSQAICIVRGGLVSDIHYKSTLDADWNLSELCRHCIWSAPEDFRKDNIRQLSKIEHHHKTPTSTWRYAMGRKGIKP